MPACENKLAQRKTAVKRLNDGTEKMAENVVGETGFEPATLCSQSQTETRNYGRFPVKQGQIRANRIKDLLAPCKIGPDSLARQIAAWILVCLLALMAFLAVAATIGWFDMVTARPLTEQREVGDER